MEIWFFKYEIFVTNIDGYEKLTIYKIFPILRYLKFYNFRSNLLSRNFKLL